tara:strand:- start:257 stop:2701 length:2445 start_codon:yes stop_codon:yes gene_type:complete
LKVTLIESSNGIPLQKRFNADKTFPFPNTRELTSHECEIENTKELTALIKDASSRGWALMRGHFTEKLTNQSRKGKHDRQARTERLTLDFDKVPYGISSGTVIDSRFVEHTARSILLRFGQLFNGISCVVSASSSFGCSPGHVSFHVEILLEKQVETGLLKRWLQFLNLTYFKNEIELSSLYGALKWPLDVSVADNSKIIYIAPPLFDGVKDPFDGKDDQRIVHLQGAVERLPVDDILALDVGKVKANAETIIKKLRKEQGLRGHAPRTKAIRINEEDYELLMNPDPTEITICDDDGEYIRADINGGDSGAYWWPKCNPDIVYNFKGEPVFKMKQAAPIFYNEYKDKYKSEILQSHGLKPNQVPIVFREPNEDIYYSMIYNDVKDEISHFAAISQSSITNFLKTWGADVPETLPEYILEFDPTTNQQVDLDKGWVNKFRPNKYLKASGLPKGVDDVTEYGSAAEVFRNHAPYLMQCITHALGDAEDEIEHFINWLCYIIQTREKSATAWILLGRSGTGKGLLFDSLFKPVFGEYAKTAKTDTIEDDKNGYLEDALILFVDEFKERDSRSSSRTHNILKNMVTEKSMVIRHMRQTAKTMRNYTNIIFSSNDLDILKLGNDDRRFNIGSRQQTELIKTYPDLPLNILNEDQLYKFCQLANAHKVDTLKVRELIENEWKDKVQLSSMSFDDEFFFYLQEGNLDHFIEYVIYNQPDSINNELLFNAARGIVFNWIELRATMDWVKTADLKAVYNALAKNPQSTWWFKSQLEKRGFTQKRKRINGEHPQRAIPIKWELKVYNADEVLSRSKGRLVSLSA